MASVPTAVRAAIATFHEGGAAWKRLGILVCWGMQFLAHPAGAAEWSMESSIRVKGEYNDNIELTTEPHRAVWGAIVAPDVKFAGATETLTVTGGLLLSFNRYLDQPGLNTNNYALTLRSSYKMTERDQLALNIDSTRDPTLVSELATTGVVLAYRQRNLLNVSPSWTRAFTESTSVIANYGYTAVDYDDTAGTGLTDYRFQFASVALQSDLSERGRLVVVAYGDLYENDPSSYDARTYGVRAGYSHSFSETVFGSLSVGWRTTQSTLTSQVLVCDGPVIEGICFGEVTVFASTAKERTSGYTLDAFLEKRSETDTLSGRLSRQIYPSGQGSLIQSDRAGITWATQWSPALRVSLDASAYQTKDVGTINAGGDGRYYRIEPRLSWRLTESWNLDAGYSHAWQRYDSNPQAATANVAFATLRYTWPKLAVAR